MANHQQRDPQESRVRSALRDLAERLCGLHRDPRGVVATEYLGAVFACALVLVVTYREYNTTLTDEVRTRVGFLSTGAAPQALDNGGNRPPGLAPWKPGQPGTAPKPGGTAKPGTPNTRSGAPNTRPGAARPASNPTCTGASCPRPGQCFTAGTLVHTADGDRPIESVELGDLVWSRNDQTGELGLKPVTHRFVTEDMPVFEIGVEGDVASELLRVTAGHPFWVEQRGWVDSDELEEGAVLWSPDGTLTGHPGAHRGAREKVYNLEVADFHTYFVGALHAWVHNSPECPLKRMPMQEVCFEISAEHRALGLEDEWEDQLLTQESGLGEMTVEQYLKNRKHFEDHGRQPDPSQRRERREQRNYIAESAVEVWMDREHAAGRTPSRADVNRKRRQERRTADALISAMAPQAATHNPDQVAGGNLGTAGLGDLRVNSAIGASWTSRVAALDAAAKKVPADQRAHTLMNVSLYASASCP